MNYFLTDRLKSEIADQTLMLERIKTDVAIAAQRTADTAVKIDQARLALEHNVATSNRKFETIRLTNDSTRTVTDQARLTAEFSKLSNDLRPNLSFSCNGSSANGTLFVIHCTVTNKGAHRVGLITVRIARLNSSQPNNSEEVPVPPGSNGSNTVLTNGIGSLDYEIPITRAEGIGKSLFKLHFFAKTDQQAVEMARRLGGNVFTEFELKELSTNSYAYTVSLN